ncbi:MAG: histidinol-phosphatase [Spirochaetaceae bacterium]|nr:histidinol-phosphatase [Spirochaetaceae bacterium]
MLANYHTHTPRCNHAQGSEREYIERAIECGFKVLGFSDHTPQPYPKDYVSTIRMGMDEIEDYTGTLAALREEYKDKIKILIGYEVEYTHKYFDRLITELKKFPLDYIIQGQHFAPDEVSGAYMGFKSDDEDRLKAYVDLTIEGMKTGLFSYLAHPDLINFTGDDETYQKHMRRIVEASLECGLPLEVNMLGFVGGRNYPCDRFFKMASEMGAQFVIGCDAHAPEAIMQPQDAAGFTAFLERNGISTGDNLIELRDIVKLTE